MKNFKYIDANALKSNLQVYGNKKVCAMVKSNAYGHGTKEIVSLLTQSVDYFGVSNAEEGKNVKKYTDKPVIVCSKTSSFDVCEKNGLDVIVDDLSDLKKCLDKNITNIHLKIDCGMNRFGVKKISDMQKIDKFATQYNIKFKSVCTHFPFTDNCEITEKNYRDFLKMKSFLSQKTMICFGGSGVIDYNFDFDMIRVGIGLYGYGREDVSPVMKISSFVSKIFSVQNGEEVGYSGNYTANKEEKFAVVPVGYGDGLRRNLSNNFSVLINGKVYKSVANICMDAFFVSVDKSVKVGDVVDVMSDADVFAEKLETIPYEILTGFSNFRGTTLIVKD